MSISKKSTKVLAALAALPLIAALAGCATTSDTAGAGSSEANETVKIGVVGKSDPQWPAFVEAAEAEGITVELVDFGSYDAPNPALSAGDLDLNQFQHIVYLAEYNVASGDDLAVIGSTAIYPLNLYSGKYTDVADIPAGSTVAVPDDVTNLARALLVLQSNKLIELKGGGTIFSGLNDIDTEKSKVKVTALEASLIPAALPDVAAAIINNDFVQDAGLTFSDAIAQDDATDPKALPYVNIFASRAEDKDNATYNKLVEIFQTDEAVQAGLQEASGDTAVALATPVAELQESLATVQADIEATK
jgi:D-methionine transport system substrate-binding protein